MEKDNYLWQDQNYATFFEEMTKGAGKKLKNKAFLVGEIKPEWQTALKKYGVELESREIIQRGEDVIHATRRAKNKQIAKDFWLKIQQHIKKPNATLLDKNAIEPAILFLYKEKSGLAKKIVIQPNKILKNGKVANILRTGGIIDPQGLTGSNCLLIDGEKFWDKKR